MFKLKKLRHFIVDEGDVMIVLKAVSNYQQWFDGSTGNCGWADEPNKWFVTFRATDKQYKDIIKKLKEFGHFIVKYSPGGMTEICFERA